MDHGIGPWVQRHTPMRYEMILVQSVSEPFHGFRENARRIAREIVAKQLTGKRGGESAEEGCKADGDHVCSRPGES